MDVDLGLIGYRFTRRKDGTVSVQRLETGSDPNEIDLRCDLANHSPTGFEVGYEGSGPAQTALAVLADAVDDETALEHYQSFKRDVISDCQLDPGESKQIAAGVVEDAVDESDPSVSTNFSP